MTWQGGGWKRRSTTVAVLTRRERLYLWPTANGGGSGGDQASRWRCGGAPIDVGCQFGALAPLFFISRIFATGLAFSRWPQIVDPYIYYGFILKL